MNKSEIFLEKNKHLVSIFLFHHPSNHVELKVESTIFHYRCSNKTVFLSARLSSTQPFFFNILHSAKFIA